MVYAWMENVADVANGKMWVNMPCINKSKYKQSVDMNVPRLENYVMINCTLRWFVCLDAFVY